MRSSPQRSDFDLDAARQMFASLTRTSAHKAPTHSAVASHVANNDDIVALMAAAPREQRHPVLLMAVLHWLVLGAPDSHLAQWYPTVTANPRDPDEPELAQALLAFVEDHDAEIADLLGWRRTQTNEVGRCALFVAALSQLDGTDQPLAHIDVGTSAGLNLALGHYAYRFDDGPTLGTSPLTLRTSSRNAGFVGTRLPTIETSIGIESSPLDVRVDADARWLQACVWPGQTDRFERLSDAIALAQALPLDIRQGDATDMLGPVIDHVDTALHPLVTSSWVLNYFSSEARQAFLNELDLIGQRRDFTFVFAESPTQTPELPHPASVHGTHTTVLGAITWRNGAKTTRALAEADAHGAWYDRID